MCQSEFMSGRISTATGDFVELRALKCRAPRFRQRYPRIRCMIRPDIHCLSVFKFNALDVPFEGLSGIEFNCVAWRANSRKRSTSNRARGLNAMCAQTRAQIAWNVTRKAERTHKFCTTTLQTAPDALLTSECKTHNNTIVVSFRLLYVYRSI